MRKGYPSKLRRSVVGYASAGFAEVVKMPRAEARGASLDSLDFFDHPFFPEVLEPIWYLAGPSPKRLEIGPDNGHPSLLKFFNQRSLPIQDQFIVELSTLLEGIDDDFLIFWLKGLPGSFVDLWNNRIHHVAC